MRPSLSADQRNQLHKGDVGRRPDHELLIEALRLFVVNDHKEAVFSKPIQRPRELLLPIYRPVLFQTIFRVTAVQDSLGIGRLDQAAENTFVLPSVEFLYLVMNPLQYQLPDSDPFTEKLERQFVQGLPGRRFIANAKQHFGPPERAHDRTGRVVRQSLVIARVHISPTGTCRSTGNRPASLASPGPTYVKDY